MSVSDLWTVIDIAKLTFFVCMCLFCLLECSFYSKLKREGKWEKRNCVKEVKNKSSVFSSSVCLPICLCVKLLRPYFFFQLQVYFYLILAFDFYFEKGNGMLYPRHTVGIVWIHSLEKKSLSPFSTGIHLKRIHFDARWS